MKQWQVWTEGYRATGNSSGAIFHGIFYGETFKDAVIAYRDSLTDERSKKCIDVERMTDWGCRFFDKESEARRSFG